MTKANALYGLLLSLESSVYDPEVRRSRELSAPLFAEDFVEFGGNGKIYNKASIVEALLVNSKLTGKPELANFEAKQLDDRYTLVTYRLRMLDDEGVVESESLRSTLYRLEGSVWKQLFHQATKL